MSVPIVSVIMPVYNERATIEKVTRKVLSSQLPDGHALELVVVDDGSTDGTVEILERLSGELPVKLLRHAHNRGKGAALRTGLAEASGAYFLFQDSDLEYDPQDYLALLSPLVANRADIVFGSRFAGASGHGGMALVSRLANRFLTRLSNWMTGLGVSDMETGYKAFRRDAMAGIELRENGFGVEPEVTAKLAPAVLAGRLRLTEIGVSYRPRGKREGKKIRFRDGVWAIVCIVRYGLWARFTPVPAPGAAQREPAAPEPN